MADAAAIHTAVTALSPATGGEPQQAITLLRLLGVTAVSQTALLGATVLLSVVAFLLLVCALGRTDLHRYFIRRHLYGIDINKVDAEQLKLCKRQMETGGLDAVPDSLRRFVLPESMGVVVGLGYFFTLLVLLGIVELSPRDYGVVFAGALSILLILLLGFMDDVLELRWRHKVVYSLLATLPLLVLYQGGTTVVVPVPLRGLLQRTTVNLGPLYLAYMALICTFSSNAINIFAGVNGLEPGQSLVIALSMLVHNAVEIGRGAHAERHLLAFVFTLPFFAVVLALFKYNRYPAKVFVGDSFTCFAGQALGSAAIVGHFSKTYCLFLIPQFINFLLSLPQILRIIPCPRHRLPRYDPKTGKLNHTPNGTLINAFLYAFGPMGEGELCRALLLFQIACSVAAFAIRYGAAGLVYDRVD